MEHHGSSKLPSLACRSRYLEVPDDEVPEEMLQVRGTCLSIGIMHVLSSQTHKKHTHLGPQGILLPKIVVRYKQKEMF